MNGKLDILIKFLNYNNKFYENILEKSVDESLNMFPIIIKFINEVECFIEEDIYEEYKPFLKLYLAFCEKCSDISLLEQNWDILKESQEAFIDFIKEIIKNSLKAKKQCICCGNKIIFMPHPKYCKILSEIYGDTPHIEETMYVDKYFCPLCGISDRGRLILAFLETINIIYSKNEISLLYIAPEKAVEDWILRNCPNVKYDSTDLYMDNVTFKSDVRNMNNISDESYDFFICSHVLENMQDDKKALEELKRILKPNGLGIFLVPIALEIDEIDEEWGFSEEENWRRFGQDDRCRLYSKKGLLNRLKEAGFYVHEFGKDFFGEVSFLKNALSDTNELYILSYTEHNTQQLIEQQKQKLILEDMEKMPLISVIFPCYNHEEFVEDAIKSVIHQTYKNIEILVVDDGSSDNSVEVLKRYSEYFTEELYLKENTQIRGMLPLLDKTKGKYIAMMHSDDIWELDKLEKQVRFLESNTKYSACFTWTKYIDSNFEEVDNNIFIQLNKSRYEWLHQFFICGNSLSHPSILINRKLYIELINDGIQAFRQLPDFLMWIRLVQKNEIYIIPEVLVKMCRHQSSKTTNTSGYSVKNIARIQNEIMYIWYKEIKQMNTLCFRKAFNKEFINRDARSDQEIECEKFFLLKNSDHHVLNIAAMLLYFDLYREQKIKDCFLEKYRYDNADFYEFDANIGIYNLELQIKQLLAENNELKK